MVIVQKRSIRKSTGGRFHPLYRSKRKFETGRKPSMTGIGDRFLKVVRTKGGDRKQKLIRMDKVNVFDPKTKKHQLVAIKTVVDSPANRNFVRRNIMTRGSIIDTAAGKARITSRPGQNGSLEAVLI